MPRCRATGRNSPRASSSGIENSSAAKRAGYSAAMRVGRAYRRRRWNGERPVVLGSALCARARCGVRSHAQEDRTASCAHRAVGGRAVAGGGAGALAGVGRQSQESLWPDRSRRRDGAVRIVSAPGSVGRPYPGGGIWLGADDEIIAQVAGLLRRLLGGPGCIGRGPPAGRHSYRRRWHARRRWTPVDRRPQEGHRHHRRRQECQPEPDRDRTEIEPLYQRSQRGRRRPQVSHGADRTRRRHRLGMGARQQRRLHELPLARHQSPPSTA